MGAKRTTPRKKINPMSAEKRRELVRERELIAKLLVKQKGKCARCSKPLGWASAKHEITFRSHGGDPTDEDNCILLCLECHMKEHGINYKGG